MTTRTFQYVTNGCMQANLLFGERSLGLWDRQSSLGGRPCCNPIGPCLETGELVNVLNPDKLVTLNPVTTTVSAYRRYKEKETHRLTQGIY